MKLTVETVRKMLAEAVGTAPVLPSEWLGLLAKLEGYYECPKDSTGKRLGPLVGYAGKYDETHQFVGDVYVNFAKFEEWTEVLRQVASEIHVQICELGISRVDAVCGLPEGGKALAVLLADFLECRYIFPDKKVKVVATAASREVSELSFGRHEVGPGEKILLVEDVINNVSSVEQAVDICAKRGAVVAGASCFFNRSPFEASYQPKSGGLSIPLVNVVWKHLPQYRQDDPAVSADIAEGNVVWKPKDKWSQLVDAMAKAKA